MPRKKKVTWNGIEYDSINAAARARGITRVTQYRHTLAGYTCDEDLAWHHNKPKPVVWNGNTYDSIEEAAKAEFVSRSAMSYRVKQGYTCDEDLQK